MNPQQFKHWRQTYASSTNIMPLIMGIINVTPDSFSDGGSHLHLDQALLQAKKLIADGADILDIGGESSRPGALPVSADEELNRVLPLIQRLQADSDICLSIDSNKAGVMQAAIAAGIGMINDRSALTEPDTLQVAAQSKLPICLMHSQGTPLTMQQKPHYHKGVIVDVDEFFSERITDCLAAGIARDNLILDPGFGFGKTVDHNLSLIKGMQRFAHHGLPLLLGVSRKSSLGAITNTAVHERLAGGIAASVLAMMQGATIIRTHDVAETKQALLVAQAIRLADNEEQVHGGT